MSLNFCNIYTCLLQVALQFPDKYLCSAALLSRIIQDRTKVEVFILADTSYGRCERDIL